jgi:tripartite-type tricarboxylate transporter receptor subunit TctC
VLTLGCSAAIASSAGAAYPERNIDVIITYGAGGGFDLYARAVARAMEKHLGGGINVIPRNVPGAGGAKGLVTLYRSPPDGYTFGLVGVPGGVQPMLLGQKVEYDLDKVTWLGVVAISRYALVVGKTSPFQTIDAFRSGKPRVPFVATAGGNDYAMMKIILGTLKTEAKHLTSFRGAPEAQLATVRGEADAALGVEETIGRHLESGDFKAILSLRPKASGGRLAGVPTVADIGHPELANLALYRLFAAPPGLPPEVAKKLTAVVQSALNDPELKAWSDKASMAVDPGTPQEAEQLYRAQKAFLARHVDLLKPPPKDAKAK